MTNEGEKGERRLLDLDEIPGEGKTVKEVTEESGEMPEEQREIILAVAKGAQAVLERFKAQQAEWEAEWARRIVTYADAQSAKLSADLARRMEPYQKELDIHLERITESAGRISAGKFTGADVGTLVGGQYKALEQQSEMIGIVQETLDTQIRVQIESERTRKEERNRYWLALGVAIATSLLSIAVQIITWWLGR